MGKFNLLQKHKYYGNILVFSPDGKPMFRCSDKQANWYIARNLAKEIVAINKYHLSGWNEIRAIKLTFQPNGLGHYSDPDLLEEQKNICCVCGSEKDLVKNYLVPREYLHQFPIEFKSRRFENRIMLCVDCLKKRNVLIRDSFSKLLGELCKVPIGGVGAVIDSKFKNIVLTAYALVQKKHFLPERVRIEKLKIIENHLGHVPTENEIIELSKSKWVDKSNYKSYGQMIVEKIVDFEMFIDVWRNHFMQTMKPKFPPSHLKRNENKEIL